MLIISRKRDEKIVIADQIEITVLEVGRNRVRFGIKAPKHIPIQTRVKNATADSVTQSIEVDQAEIAEELMPAVAGLSNRR